MKFGSKLVILLGSLAASTATADERSLQSTPLCRCEASYERLYSRRLNAGRNGQHRELVDFDYDYSDAEMDENGFFVIDGVTVLPPTNPSCSSNRRMLKGKRSSSSSSDSYSGKGKGGSSSSSRGESTILDYSRTMCSSNLVKFRQRKG